MCTEIPEESVWLSYGKELHFKLDSNTKKITAKKWINNQAHTITKDLPETVVGLSSLLNRFVNLPDEFWKPIPLTILPYES